jgi:hypothetical protein
VLVNDKLNEKVTCFMSSMIITQLMTLFLCLMEPKSFVTLHKNVQLLPNLDHFY